MNFLVIRTCTHCVLSINGVLTNYLQLLKMSYAYNLVNSIFKDHRNGRNSQKNNDIRISWQYAHLVIIPTKFHKIPVQRFERSCTYKNTRLADWLFDWLTDWLTDERIEKHYTPRIFVAWAIRMKSERGLLWPWYEDLRFWGCLHCKSWVEDFKTFSLKICIFNFEPLWVHQYWSGGSWFYM